ncbi:MAG: gliding motility-associated C-terminal domain-containing protein [Flavobacteriales bacterium]|nr:gliding motility-associated C-terminal domain-containing protein [Flavobacteriales bacterium]
MDCSRRGASNGMFTPGTSVVGAYTYTVLGNAPCMNASATVTVSVLSLPDPGIDGSITLCESGAIQDLFLVLGGSPDVGGNWTAPGGGAHSGLFDTGSDVTGVYTYTIDVPPPCVSVSSAVTISVQAPPDPGLSGSELFCVTSPATNLFNSLGGTPDAGGTWSAPGGGVFSGIFAPGTSAPGTYTYTATGTAPCLNASTTVDVVVTSEPDPGAPGVLALCATAAATDLFGSIGGTPDLGGTWSAPGGAAHSGTFDPATDATGLYTYTIAVPAPCSSVSSTVMVNVQQPPNSGLDGALTLCISGSTTALFASLGGTPSVGGTWTAPGGGAFDGSFIPGTSNAGNYTYTVDGVAPCPNASAIVTVTVTSEPDPGTPGVLTLCATAAATDLFGSLGGTPDPGGTWSAPGGAAHSGTFDPATDAAGLYTYTIAVPAPCSSVSSTVLVNVQQPPNAGLDGALTLCISGNTTALFASLGGAPSVGGTWTAPGGGAFNGSFIPGTSTAGDYAYTVDGVAPCANASAVVSVTVTSEPDPGTPGVLTLCATAAATELFGSLGGTPDPGGTWSAPGGAAHTGSFDPATDAAGLYTYTIAVPAPCSSVSSTVLVNVQQPPNAGLDGALTLCVSGNTTALFVSLGGAPSVGGTWTAPGGGAFNGSFTPGTSTAGDYTYTVNGVAPCPNASAIVVVSVASEPDPGLDAAIVLCESGSVVDMFGSLGGSPDFGGTWTAPGGAIHSSSFDPATDAAGIYTYTITVPAPCSSVASTVNIAIQNAPDPGLDATLTLCISGGPIALTTVLGGTPNGGGSWTDPGGIAFTGVFIPGTSTAGNYTYTVSGAAPCPAASALVDVVVTTEPDAGINGAILLCGSASSTDLFPLLGGTPDIGGTWTAPGGSSNNGTFDPAVDLAGVYTYTISVPLPCSGASSTVTIFLQAMPDAGTDGSLTLCSTNAAVPLFGSLNGSPSSGGSWTDPNGTAFSGTFDPATAIPGDYNYTLAGTAPCPSASALVNVSVIDPPDAGLDGSITVCTIDGVLSLFNSLGGSPGVGGVWTGPDGSAFSGDLDPSTDISGAYNYSITGTSPCGNDASQVVVTVNTPPDAGSDGVISLCANGSVANLFDQLNGAPEATGTWTSPGGGAFNGQLDPVVDLAGTYTYTVSGTAPCPLASSEVIVSITNAPDAGSDGAILLCSASPITNLFAQLGGTPDAGGLWTAPGGGPSTGSFDPATDTPGIFTYSIPGVAPCPNASANVLVNVTSNPDAGLPGNNTVCMSDAPFALLSVMNGSPDAGGIWTAPDGSPQTGNFDPAMDQSGVYTYTINVPLPCISASSNVTITTVAPANAGDPGSLTVCNSSAIQDLFGQLGGAPDLNGAWSVNGNPHTSDFDPAVDASGTFTYTVPSDAPCPAVTADVVVNVNAPPDPGTDGTTTLCISSAPVDLATFLGGTPDANGTWSINGSTHSGMLDPAVDPEGDYVYTVAGLAPCPSASSTVTVSIATIPDPGLNGSITLCETGTMIELFTQLLGTPDAGGTWSGPSLVVNGQFDPVTMIAGDYTYLIDVPLPCLSVSSSVTVNVIALAEPGTDGSVAFCITSPATDLFNELNGTPDAGGTWTDPNGAAHSPLFNPATDISGSYQYTVVGIAPCPNEISIVEVNVVSNPDPGANSGATLCLSDSPIDLFEQLGGTPDAGGTWSGPSLVNGSTFDPASMADGIYTYTIDVPPPCVSASSSVVIALSSPPDAGTNGNGLFCITSPIADLFTLIGGTPTSNGSWTNVNGDPFSGSFNPGVDVSGTYTYTVNGTWPCPADMVDVVVNVVENPDPGGDGALTLCQTGDASDLFERLEGTPDAGGIWSGPSAIPDGNFDPNIMIGGVYTYLLDAPEPCIDASTTVTVTVVAPPEPGSDGANTACGSSSPFDLFGVLQGGPQTGGVWNAPDGGLHNGTFDPATDVAGAYTYTVQGTAPCPSDAAVVNVVVITPPNAGADGEITLCPEGTTIDLIAQLGGSPDAGGSWTNPNGVGNNGSMDPAVDEEGGYLYTVSGTAPCSNDMALVLVEVSEPITATAATTNAVCHDACDGTATLNISGGTPDFILQWSNNVAGSNELVAQNLCNGIYSVSITDANGCTSSATYEILEPPALVIDAIGTGDENCIGSCDGYLNVVDGQGVLFSVDDGATWSSSNIINDLCAGGYTVLMQDANGCLASAPASIGSPDPVIANFYAAPDSLNVTNTLVSFTNQSGNAQTFVWDFAGLGTSVQGGPSFTFPDALGGIYTVCLTATNSNGCTDSICHPVVILDELYVNVPNAFTPNGDGINEGFGPIFNIPAFADEYGFMIFDRWGLLIFDSNTIGEHWNGQLNNVEVPEDVYVWKMHCRDIITKEVYDMIGHVTVVR